MRYISTRGQAPALTFDEVLLAGLASDGGLYVPEEIPRFSDIEIRSMSSLCYSDLAYSIIKLFVGGAISDEELRRMITETYDNFGYEDIAPLVELSSNQWVLELFHGPTLAFKDFALQLLGVLLDYVLRKKNRRALVMGATSGDTGSAAIAGCSRFPNLPIFVMYPHGRVSDFQRRQMTTIGGQNVHIVAVEGSFDDCQAMVKASFRDQSFLPIGVDLVAVNSINWARIVAQVVYYFYAALKLGAPDKTVAFSVPTGNFGDIFSGYIAHQMGLPIEGLVIATNENDVLHTAVESGYYQRKEAKKSYSPSMDISVSSNFERLLFDLYDRDGIAIAELMRRFDSEGIILSHSALSRLKALFSSKRVNDIETIEQISSTWLSCGYLLDPHSAIGVNAALKSDFSAETQVVSLATAHPAKFSEAVLATGIDIKLEIPICASGIFDKEEVYDILPNQLFAIQSHIRRFLKS